MITTAQTRCRPSGEPVKPRALALAWPAPRCCTCRPPPLPPRPLRSSSTTSTPRRAAPRAARSSVRSGDGHQPLRRRPRSEAPRVEVRERGRAREPALHPRLPALHAVGRSRRRERPEALPVLDKVCSSSATRRVPGVRRAGGRGFRGPDGRGVRRLRERVLAGHPDSVSPVRWPRTSRPCPTSDGRSAAAGGRSRAGSSTRSAGSSPTPFWPRSCGGLLSVPRWRSPAGAHEPRPRAPPRRGRLVLLEWSACRLRKPALRPDGKAAPEGRAARSAAARGGSRAGFCPVSAGCSSVASSRWPSSADPSSGCRALRDRHGPAGGRLRRARQRRPRLGGPGLPPAAGRGALARRATALVVIAVGLYYTWRFTIHGGSSL